MAAGAFYQDQDTALQHSAGATLEPVYLSQTVWSRQLAIIAASETAGETVALALCLRVQYPGRLQSQQCVMLYSTRLRKRVIISSYINIDRRPRFFGYISNNELLHADVKQTGN